LFLYKTLYFLLEVAVFEHERGLEAEHGEDDGRGEEGGEPVAHGDHNGVALAVVVHVVVRREGDQAAETQPERVEDLGGGVQPHSWIQQPVQLGRQRV